MLIFQVGKSISTSKSLNTESIFEVLWWQIQNTLFKKKTELHNVKCTPTSKEKSAHLENKNTFFEEPSSTFPMSFFKLLFLLLICTFLSLSKTWCGVHNTICYVVPSKTSSHEYILWNAFWQPCCWGRQHWCLMERIENTFHSNTCSTTLHPFILYSNVFTPKHLRSQIRLHTQHYRMYVVSTFHPLTATVWMYCWWASEHIFNKFTFKALWSSYQHLIEYRPRASVDKSYVWASLQ